MATVQDSLSIEGCRWKFIAAHGPHFEELREAAVKSMKCHLRRTLRSQFCHLRRTVHITCWDRGLSKLQNLVCLIWWSFQPNLFISMTFSIWWTTYPITCRWLYWRQMQKTFQVANLPTTTARVLATLVIQLPPESATASTLAEDIPQPISRRPRAAEGLQHNSITLTHISHQGKSSREGWHRPSF